jgi:hypothetical protein
MGLLHPIAADGGAVVAVAAIMWVPLIVVAAVVLFVWFAWASK